MGISLFKNCRVYPTNSPPIAPNPNPARFEILELRQIGQNVVARISYPDCVNYEGVKICLYKNMNCNKLSSLSHLDPHFSKTAISPFARFKPNGDGWEAACSLAASI